MDAKRRMRLLLSVASLVTALALAVAACGTTPGGAGMGGVPATQGGVTPVSTTSTAVSPSHPTPGAVPVVLMPGAAQYAASDTITVSVQNTTGRTIYTLAQFTDCSIISLEYGAGGSWQPVHLCTGGFPHPSITPIAPGGTVAIRLAARAASSDAGDGTTAQWPAGTYRAELTYMTSASEPLSQGTAAYSAPFAIA